MLSPLFVVLLIGCGKSMPTGRVSGSVQTDGKPVTSGTVTFEGNGRICLGVISDGRFSLIHGGSPDVPVGSYHVTIQPVFVDPVVDPVTTELRHVVNESEKQIPGRYRFAETSGLRFDVVDGGNHYDIVMTSTP